MRQHHRLEVLRHERDDEWETWTNPAGSLRVQRRVGAPHWSVEMDGGPVLDIERTARDGQISVTGVPMTAASLHDVVTRLSLQRRVHLVFDA